MQALSWHGGCRANPADKRGPQCRDRGAAFQRRYRLRQPLERVPEDIVAAGHHVDGEVGFKHAAFDAELLNCELIIAPRRLHQRFAGWRFGLLVPAEAIEFHIQAAELGDNVLAARQFSDVFLPCVENFFSVTLIRANTQRAAEMVEDDCSVRERLGQGRHFCDLRMIAPRFETELPGCQFREAFAEVWAAEAV